MACFLLRFLFSSLYHIYHCSTKRGVTAERPFFHTEPGNIAHYPQNKVECVIVERLVRRLDNGYKPNIEQLMHIKYTMGDDLYRLEEVLNNAPTGMFAEPSILIVPMGTNPMMATQLYTLLRVREKHDIQEVILLYPEGSEEAGKAARLARDAFAYEGITSRARPIAGLRDLAFKMDYELYQAALEQIITGLQATILQQHPDWRIDLAISGGRKGMASMRAFLNSQKALQ